MVHCKLGKTLVIINSANFDHADCFVCGHHNPRGLHLQFETVEAGCCATVAVDNTYQGYSKMVHGGIVASLLDSAMTHCLFAQNIQAVTVDMSVRYNAPVPLQTPITIQATLVGQRHGVFSLCANILKNNQILAQGKARFMKQ
jgi:acyl-coenzyme A thioesterase PaaI-like protein